MEDHTDVYAGQITWYSTPYDENTKLRIEDDLINKGGEKDMMGLYEIYGVDTKRNVLVDRLTFVAKDETKAKMKFLHNSSLGNNVDADNLELFTLLIGEWKDEKPREVKIVKEE